MTSHAAASPVATVASGDLVHLDFELWAEGGAKPELIGTTREEVAQDALGQLPQGRRYGPRPHLIGGPYFPSGIEQTLVGSTVGNEITKEFAAVDAFGERDPKLIELFSMHEIERLPEMRRQDAHLDVGTILTIRGREGRVVTLTQARVRVDFNPPFAGRKVRGKFKIVDRITDPDEQVRALIEIEYGRPGSEFHVEIRDHVVTIKVPDRAKFDPSWFGDKPRIVDRIRTQISPKSIRFVEEYVTPTPEKTESAAAPAGALTAPSPPSSAPGTSAPAGTASPATGTERSKTKPAASP